LRRGESSPATITDSFVPTEKKFPRGVPFASVGCQYEAAATVSARRTTLLPKERTIGVY